MTDFDSETDSDYEDDVTDDEQVEVNIRIPSHKLEEFECLLKELFQEMGIQKYS